jgi:hypothetical protein
MIRKIELERKALPRLKLPEMMAIMMSITAPT